MTIIPFQSTPSAWRETKRSFLVIRSTWISIHSLRMEGDSSLRSMIIPSFHFNPLPPHGGRLHGSFHNFRFRHISIHSLRMEGDNTMCEKARNFGISIHSLRMEGDRFFHLHRQRHLSFQSTPSAWRETLLLLFPVLVSVFQSTPSAWRETIAKCAAVCYDSISIHSLRMEGDAFSVISQRYVSMDFNPLPPHGGRPLD